MWEKNGRKVGISKDLHKQYYRKFKIEIKQIQKT